MQLNLWIFRSLQSLNAHPDDIGDYALFDDAVDHPAPPRIGTLALVCSTYPHFFPQFHMEVFHEISTRPVVRVPYSLYNRHDQKLAPGTASTIHDLAFINSCLYLGTHSNVLRIICFMTSSRSVSHILSVALFFLAFWRHMRFLLG